jgi:hypothetical protein
MRAAHSLREAPIESVMQELPLTRRIYAPKEVPLGDAPKVSIPLGGKVSLADVPKVLIPIEENVALGDALKVSIRLMGKIPLGTKESREGVDPFFPKWPARSNHP